MTRSPATARPRSLLGSRPPVVAGFCAAIATFVALRYSGLFGASVESWAEDIAWTAFSAAAAGWSLTTSRRAATPRHRTGWILLALAAAAWALGMLYLVSRYLTAPVYIAFPTPANWLFLSFAPLFAMGIYYLRARQGGSGPSGKRLADLGMISCTVAGVAVIALLDPLLRTGRAFDAILLSVLDPAAFATAALFTMTLLWLGDLDDLGVVGRLLFAAIVVHLGANLLYFRGQLEGSPLDLPLEGAWLVAFALQALAADAYGRGEVPPERSATRDSGGRPHRGPLEASLPAPLLMIMAGVGLAFREQLSEPVVAVLVALLLVFATCLGIREWWIDRSEERTYRKLQASMDLANQILVASPAAVFAYDLGPGGRTTFFSGNVESVFGPGADRTWDWDDRVHPDEVSGFHEHVDAALAHGGRTFECRVRDHAGGYRWVNIRLALHRTDDEGPARLVGSLVDVDALKRYEGRLLRGQRMEALGPLGRGRPRLQQPAHHDPRLLGARRQ